MDQVKRRRLEAKGWKVGSTADFLALTHEQSIYVDLKLRLSDALKERRKERGISQSVLAARVGSSQSRVAKMESADSSVSIDLLIRSLIELGVSLQGLGRIMGVPLPESGINPSADLNDVSVDVANLTLAPRRNLQVTKKPANRR